MQTPGRPLTNTQKIATFLYGLGPEKSACILEHLSPEQVAAIAREIVAMGKVPHQVTRAVVREFRALVQAEEQRHESMAFAEHVLDRTMGTSQAHAVMQRIRPSVSPAGPSLLTTVTPTRGAELLADEPPALAAMLLLSLPRDTAAAILVQLPADRQTDVALRLTTTAPPSAAVGAQLERALRAKAARCRQEEARNGEHALDALLPAEGPEFDDPVCDTEAASASSFHLLHRVDRWVLRAAFRFASTADLCHALRGADPRLRDYLLSALAPEHRRTVQYRLRTTQALPVRVITAAQARLVELVRTAPSSAEEADAVPLRTPVHA